MFLKTTAQSSAEKKIRANKRHYIPSVHQRGRVWHGRWGWHGWGAGGTGGGAGGTGGGAGGTECG